MKLAVLLLSFFAARVESPTGSRITPPTIASVSPRGVARGTTIEIEVDGLNLSGASAIFLSEPRIHGRIVGVKDLPDASDVRLGSNGTLSTIDLGPLPPRNQVTVELDIPADVPSGAIDFRIQTPLGTTPMGRFLVEPFYGESTDREPDDTADEAVEAFLPAIFTGAISKPGDEDFYKIQPEPGETLNFADSSFEVNSSLRPVVAILDADQKVLREVTLDRDHPGFSQKFTSAGPFYLRISDYENSGSAGHTYRVIAGKEPLPKKKILPADLKTYGQEVTAQATNTSVQSAQTLSLPVTVKGTLTAHDNFFRFHASKGEKVIVDVNARRIGSPLDSLIEVLDSSGHPIERATVRATLETATALRDHDSAQQGIRLTSMSGFQPGDFVMIGSEIMRVETMPPNPDSDFIFESFGNRRVAQFDTSSEDHALDSPVYKVQIAPPGTKFASNGLPLVHLNYRNDDGGPGYDKDSRLHFTAPADGDFLVRISDVRGLHGQDYAYRLSVRQPQPSYRLSVNPDNPNVPAGGRIPITVTAMRMDDHNAPIEVSVKDLPPGLHATTATILPGDDRTTILLSADADAKLPLAVPLTVTSSTGVQADPDEPLKLISMAPKPDIQLTAESHEAVLKSGGTVDVQVSIQRNNGFAGRVPVEVLNLPPGVEVSDTGLNGVLINENETRRTFTLRMLPTAKPHTQPIYVAGKVETRSKDQNLFATQAITLKIE